MEDLTYQEIASLIKVIANPKFNDTIKYEDLEILFSNFGLKTKQQLQFEQQEKEQAEFLKMSIGVSSVGSLTSSMPSISRDLMSLNSRVESRLSTKQENFIAIKYENLPSYHSLLAITNSQPVVIDM